MDDRELGPAGPDDEGTGLLPAPERPESVRRLVARRLLKPWVVLTHAVGVVATRLMRPGEEERRLRREAVTLRDALNAETQRARDLMRDRDRVVELARARGVELGGRPPATPADLVDQEERAERGATVLTLDCIGRRE